MKWYGLLTIFACACLAGAAVWLGALNQDEGWYLYAANLVHEGQRVYRDFAFTQGPVMPRVYAAFTWIWAKWGLLGARVFTLGLGLVGVAFAALMARGVVLHARGDALAPQDNKTGVGNGQQAYDNKRAGNAAALIVAMLLGCNLYHLYYLAIPKTYALAGLFVIMGMWWCIQPRVSRPASPVACFLGGFLLAMAAGVRISLGAILPVVGVAMLVAVVRRRAPLSTVIGFGVGGLLGLFTAYGFVLFDPQALKGFLAAQSYHAARGGFDVVWAVGSVSRLVRWYLPVFIVLGLGVGMAVCQKGTKATAGTKGTLWMPGTGVLLASFLAVFVVQMAAPFPYEDYQVPIMGLLTVFAAVNFVPRVGRKQQAYDNKIGAEEGGGRGAMLLLVLGLCFASSFGSPLLEKWMTNGQDRFWSRKKTQCELAQLRDVARRIQAIDPQGTAIFTQDTYLAIETNRKVPKGLEMGPFSVLIDAEWRDLILHATCPIATVSGYTFAVEPPKCNERPIGQQLEYLRLLKENYELVDQEPDFGQNATTLLVLKRKGQQAYDNKIGAGNGQQAYDNKIGAGSGQQAYDNKIGAGNGQQAYDNKVEK